MIAELFDATRKINQAESGEIGLTAEQIEELHQLFDTFFFEILGMRPAGAGESSAPVSYTHLPHAKRIAFY